MFRRLFMPLLALIATSCNNGSYKSIDSNGPNCPNKTEKSESTNSSNQAEGIMQTCPMCMGNKQIQYYTGEIILCPVCEGNGAVSSSVAQQLQEATQLGEQAANDFLNGTTGSSGSEGVGLYRNSEQIQAEIDQCEREISNLQSGLEGLDQNSTIYIYYSQELINLQYKLRKLQYDLHNAE